MGRARHMRDRHQDSSTSSDADEARGPAGAPGKVPRTSAIQRRAQLAPRAPELAHAPPRAPQDDPFGLHLPDGVRASMESSFGADFQSVRVHEGQEAAALGAIAYTQGEHLHFQPGAYDPGSASGRELIGHELAHVVQQREGRVAAPQGKGDPVNADPALEAEADVQGARAARGEPAGNTASTHRAPAAAGAVQRKVVFSGSDTMTTEEIMRVLGELGVLGDAEVIYHKVLRGKPSALVQQPGLKFLDVEDATFQKHLIDAWRAGPGEHSYARTREDGERLFEHALTYHLHTKHHWRNIGVAQYMTGDATALALAPLVDPNLTIEILTGQQKKGEKEQSPSFLGKDGTLPPYFAGAQAGGHIVFSDTDNRDDFKGTSERYGKTFNPHVNENVLPWNKETWEATDVLGKAFRDPEQRDLVRSKLQLGTSEGDEATKRKIEEYKLTKLDPAIGGRPCVFLWGRTSGKKGGAHTELDSHAQMMIQLAVTMRRDFPGHTIVLVGDPVITTGDLARAGIENHAMALGEFWNDETYGAHMKDRNAQRYLFQLFDKENRAVSIGMRSGSLEGMALLGMRVVFLDDQGNNAEGRMEFWSGDGAHDRGQLVRGGAEQAQLDEHERTHQGPMPTYKRVGTLMTMGDQIDLRAKILQRGRALAGELLGSHDHAGSPMCTDEGNPRGVGMIRGTFGEAFDGTLMVGRMPTDPKLARAFTDKLDTFCNLVTSGNYRGKAAEAKGTQFGTGAGDVQAMIEALRRDLREDEDGIHAAAALEELSGMTDVTDVGVVGDHETSATARGLFGSLLTRTLARTPLTKEDAAGFVARYAQRKGGITGKRTEAQPGAAKFPRARVTAVQTGIATLEHSNVLQPDELAQVSHLTGFLSEQRG